MSRNSIKFPKQLMQGVVGGYADGYEVIEDTVTETSRWSVIHYCVFKEVESGRIFGVNYSEGATEMQDESPFEYDSDEIEVDELREVKVVVTKYVDIDS